jgi:hypothetical protein
MSAARIDKVSPIKVEFQNQLVLLFIGQQIIGFQMQISRERYTTEGFILTSELKIKQTVLR